MLLLPRSAAPAARIPVSRDRQRKTWGIRPTSLRFLAIRERILDPFSTSSSYRVRSRNFAQSGFVHFQGPLIRLVSCYALLSGCRLPWPPPSCLYERTPFLVTVTSQFESLSVRLVHPTAPVLLTRYGPLEENPWTFKARAYGWGLGNRVQPHSKFENKSRSNSPRAF